jgi:signal-transduction protein with cAMP-binding, CBS, and nucleotidyltransferase domain
MEMAAETPTQSNAEESAVASAFPRHEQTFPVLTSQEIARMRRFGEPRHYQDGERLFETGKPGPGMFVLLSGHVALTSRQSLIRGLVNFWPKSANFPAASRWSTAMPRATSKRC